MENTPNESQMILEFGKCLLGEQHKQIKLLEDLLNVPFHHAPECPLERVYMNKSEEEIKEIEGRYLEMIKVKNKKVKFASVGVLVDNKNNVLITRRTAKLNTFPNAWVFPGGQLDKGENFTQALIREIKEEVGIDLANLDVKLSIKPLLLYESCFPDEFPTSQVLVVFYIVTIDKDKDDIKLEIQTDEVSAYAWVDSDLLRQILSSEDPNNKKIHKSKINFEFQGYEYNKALDKFVYRTFTQNNFHVFETGEYIPYGHYLACKHIFV